MKKFLLILLASGFSLKINGGQTQNPQQTEQTQNPQQTEQTQQPKLQDLFSATIGAYKGFEVGADCCPDTCHGCILTGCVNVAGFLVCGVPLVATTCALECAYHAVTTVPLKVSDTAGKVIGNLTNPVAQSAATVLGAIRLVQINTDHRATHHYINSQPGAQAPQIINPDDLLRDAINS